MHGRHLKKRGQWWHYYRNRPKRYRDVEPRSVVTFALKTNCISEAKLKAAQISRDLEQKWEIALVRGVSLSSLNETEKFLAAIETNKENGFLPVRSTEMQDDDLLNRLRFLLNGNIPNMESKAVLGMIRQPQLSMMEAFERFWGHIEDEWVGLSPDQKRCKRNVYLKSIRHFEEAVGDVKLYEITRPQALEFRSWWMNHKKENGLKACTANREIDSVRRLIRVNHDIDGYEGKNPFDRVRLKREVKTRRSPISSELIKNNILADGKLDGLHSDFQREH